MYDNGLGEGVRDEAIDFVKANYAPGSRARWACPLFGARPPVELK